jgi:hypothetical protein
MSKRVANRSGPSKNRAPARINRQRKLQAMRKLRLAQLQAARSGSASQ